MPVGQLFNNADLTCTKAFDVSLQYTWHNCTEVCIWNFSLPGPKVYPFTIPEAFPWCRHLPELATQFPGIATRRLSTCTQHLMTRSTQTKKNF